MKTLKLPEAKQIFRDLGKDVHDLTPCCHATVWKGMCPVCGQPVVMPFYFFSTKPIPDDIARAHETRVRAQVPVGCDLVMWVNPDNL